MSSRKLSNGAGFERAGDLPPTHGRPPREVIDEREPWQARLFPQGRGVGPALAEN